jgi:hypothetical protein
MVRRVLRGSGLWPAHFRTRGAGKCCAREALHDAVGQLPPASGVEGAEARRGRDAPGFDSDRQHGRRNAVHRAEAAKEGCSASVRPGGSAAMRQIQARRLRRFRAGGAAEQAAVYAASGCPCDQLANGVVRGQLGQMRFLISACQGVRSCCPLTSEEASMARRFSRVRPLFRGYLDHPLSADNRMIGGPSPVDSQAPMVRIDRC